MTRTIARFETQTERFNPPADQRQLFVTSSLLDELGLEDGQVVEFRVGAKRRRLQIVLQTFEQDGLDRIFRLTRRNALLFGLINGGRYWIGFTEEDRVFRILRRVSGK